MSRSRSLLWLLISPWPKIILARIFLMRQARLPLIRVLGRKIRDWGKLENALLMLLGPKSPLNLYTMLEKIGLLTMQRGRSPGDRLQVRMSML